MTKVSELLFSKPQAHLVIAAFDGVVFSRPTPTDLIQHSAGAGWGRAVYIRFADGSPDVECSPREIGAYLRERYAPAYGLGVQS